MDVSIVIVSWNVRDQLKKCIKSIYNNTHNLDYEIFVVDNCSSDHSTEMVQNDYSKVKLISNKVNFGFAYACNQAIKKSRGNYILLLNPDTEVKQDSVVKMKDFMQNKKDCGIAGCKIVNFDGTIQPSVRKFPDIKSHLMILLKIHNFITNSKSINSYYLKDFDYSKLQIVDQVMGAFYMIKRRVLQDIGLLDEHFYIWYEEVDLCKRAKLKSWNTYYNPEIEVFHYKGSSFSQVNPLKKQYIFNRSMLYYFFKHENIFKYLVLLLVFPISLFLSFIVQIIGYHKKSKDL
ncbi:MAG: glycosyltransferase family 2 protein [bacterium]|nr:glycosyltransferase family 2 protein [bacterium]